MFDDDVDCGDLSREFGALHLAAPVAGCRADRDTLHEIVNLTEACAHVIAHGFELLDFVLSWRGRVRGRGCGHIGGVVV